MKTVTKYFDFCLSKTQILLKYLQTKKSVHRKNKYGFFINSAQLSHKQSVLLIIE